MSFDYFSKRRMQYILEKLKTIFDTKADASDVPQDLSDLSDVTISSPANGQVPTYNNTTGKWENQNLPNSTDLFTITVTSSEDPETGETTYTADKLPSEVIAAYNNGDIVQLVMSSEGLPYYFILSNAFISEDESESETGFIFQRLFVYDDDEAAFGEFILGKEQNVDEWGYIEFIHNFLAVGSNSLVAEITENNNVYTCNRTFEEVSNAYYGSKDIFIKFGSRIFKISKYDSSTTTFYFTSTIANANGIDAKTFVMTGSYITEDWTSITLTESSSGTDLFTITLTMTQDPQTGEVTFTSDKLPSEVIAARNSGSIIRLTIVDEAKYYFDLSIDHIAEEETGFIFTNVRASSNHQVVFVGFNLIKDANSDTWASIELLDPVFNETIFIEMEESSGEYSCNVDFNTLDDAYYSSTDMIIEFESEFFRLVKYDTSENTFYFANTVSDSNGIKTRTFVMVGDDATGDWDSIILTESSSRDPNAIKWNEAKTSVKKNWLSLTTTTQTVNDVTFTVNDDGTITANGTASAITQISINDTNRFTNLGSYVLSGCPSGGGNTTFDLRTDSNVDGSSDKIDTGDGIAFSKSTNSGTRIIITIRSGYVANNLVFSPMIRLASVQDDTYVPFIYDNKELNEKKIDWIGANTSVKKNWLKPTIVNVTRSGITFTSIDNGGVLVSGTSTADWAQYTTEEYVLVKAGTYIFSCHGTANDQIQAVMRLKDSGNYAYANCGTESVAFTLPNDVYAGFFITVKTSGTAVNQNVYVMLRLASVTDNTYVPYIPDNTELIDWKSNGILGTKNLLPNAYVSKTVVNGITFTVNSDGTIVANGTATANASFKVAPLSSNNFQNGSYILSGCPQGGSNSKYFLEYSNGVNFAVADYGSGVNIDSIYDYSSYPLSAVYIQIRNGEFVSNIVFKPMLRLALDTDDTYQPYSKTNQRLTNDSATWENVKTSVKKNLIPYPYRSSTRTVNGVTFTDNGDGSITINGTATETATFSLFAADSNPDLREILLNKEITISGGTQTGPYLYFYNYNGVNSLAVRAAQTITFTNSSSDFNMSIAVEKNVVANNITIYPMIRFASIRDDSYAKYIPDNTELLPYSVNDILGAKNLLPNNATSRVVNDTTFTVASDGSISISGAPSSVIGKGAYDIYKGTLQAGKYIISSGATFSGGADLYYAIGTGSATPVSTTPNFKIASGGQDIEVWIYIPQGVDLSSKVVYPMIRLASDTDNTYVPYSMTNRQLTEEVQKTVWTSAVSALTGATSVTITNASIHTTSVIEPFADNGTNTAMATPTQTVTEGQCVLGFPALSADTSFKLRITN